MRKCEIDGCENKHYGRGYCAMHHYRWSKNADPHIIKPGHRFTEQDASKRIAERSQPQGDCIVYIRGTVQRSGHRNIGFRGRRVGVHRVAWILANGEVPNGIDVLHRCDVPSCVNVDHLFLGTHADNNADRDRKGRHRPLRGSANGYAKLSEYQVIEIREHLANGETQRAIAKRYGVSQYAIWTIAAGRRWKHVPKAAA